MGLKPRFRPQQQIVPIPHPTISQGINESANFRDRLLPAEITVHEKWLPAETVYVILLTAESLGRKLNHTDSLSAGSLITRTVSAGSYLPSTTVSTGSKRSRTVSAEAKYDEQSLQEA